MEVLFTHEVIQRRVLFLADKISSDYGDKPLSLISVLKGSIHFTSDLYKLLWRNDIPLNFIRAISYEGTSQSKLEIFSFLDKKDIENQDVLIIEDIVDTGKTLNEIISYVSKFNPKSIEVCTLLDKPSKRTMAIVPEYIGFEIRDLFVVGYGMDYNGKFRNLNDIMIYE